MSNRDRRIAARGFVFGLSIVVPVCMTAVWANERPASKELSRLAIGPISFVDSHAGVLEVLGQQFKLTPATREIGWNSQSIPAVGDYVLTVGLEADQGIATAVVARISSQYVPGASPVFLRTGIDSVRHGVAQTSGGSVTIDLTGSMDDERASASNAGSVVDVLGLQPQPGGRVIALSLAEAASGARHPAVAGTLLSISGSDLELLSITSSDYSALSVSGVDLAGHLGHTGVAIPLGALLSISGSDNAGLSISGSDSARLSISGSDSAQWSISGSDNAGLSISGSDSDVLSISGSDRR